MSQPQFKRDGTLWYVSDGYIWDSQPASYRRDPARPLECSSKLFIHNPQRRSAKVTVRFYHTDHPPTAVKLTVAPGAIETLELASLTEVPHNQSFWIAVEANVPVLPQAIHEDYTLWDPVPDAMVGVAPYPGPLADETTLVMTDCFQMDPVRGWYENEILTILNPSEQEVTVRVRYLLRNWELGGEETIEIPAERVAQLEVWKRRPKLLDRKNGPPVAILSEYVARLDATGPIVAQTTRRARWVGQTSVVGSRSTMAVPMRGKELRPWYYPGGDIVDRGILPRAKPADHPLAQCDNTWNLLFLHNLDEEASAHARVRFHRPDGSSTTSDPLEIPPFKSIFRCLHAEPWLGTHTHVNEPFALTVTADKPIVPEMCDAEFEMWSQVCPGAMAAVHFYPGPLTDERTWWLGVGRAGGADDINTEWSQIYYLFNPDRKPVQVQVSFHGLGAGTKKLSREIPLPPGAVARLDCSEVPELPIGTPFAARADGDGPFCVQVFGRSFTRGLPHSRAMYSFIGVPMKLDLE